MASIQRGDAAGIIPVDYSNSFLEAVTAESAALSTFKTIRIGTKVNTVPLLSALPTAGWVTESDTDAEGVKPTSKAQFVNKTITAEEVAVIVPVHENVIEDSTIDLWEYIRPLVGQAFGQKIDSAIFFGTGKPASFAAGLVPQAITAGNIAEVEVGSDLIDAFNAAYGFVEADGYDVTDVYSGPVMRSRLRGLRATDGTPLYADLRAGNGNEQVFGANLNVVKNGTWADATAWSLVADRSKLVVALRSDMEYKVLTEATVGGINLAERDMVALRVKMRLGWETITNATALSATPVPVAIVREGV